MTLWYLILLIQLPTRQKVANFWHKIYIYIYTYIYIYNWFQWRRYHHFQRFIWLTGSVSYTMCKFQCEHNIYQEEGIPMHRSWITLVHIWSNQTSSIKFVSSLPRKTKVPKNIVKSLKVSYSQICKGGLSFKYY